MSNLVTRRTALAVLGGAAVAVLPSVRVFAQQPTRLRVMTLQSAPAQLQAYAEIVAAFEAAYAGNDVPDLIMQLTAAPIFSLQGEGLIQPMTDVVREIGEADFDENA